MVTLRIHSTPMIYSPGMFRWIEEAIKDEHSPYEPEFIMEMLNAMGIPEELHLATLGREYTSRTEGETLVLTYDLM